MSILQLRNYFVTQTFDEFLSLLKVTNDFYLRLGSSVAISEHHMTANLLKSVHPKTQNLKR